MSARSVSVGSQPAIELACDTTADECYEVGRFFVDDFRTARADAGRQGWRHVSRPGFASSDYCPKHSGNREGTDHV